MKIGIVVHGPNIIDSGYALKLIELLKNYGDVSVRLGGTMGRTAVIDACLEGIIDISRKLVPSDSLKIFYDDDVDLIFEKEAIEEIANEAIRQKTGARGLRTIVEKMLMDIMFQIPDIKGKKQFTVTKKIVQGKEKNLSEKILQLPDAS